MSEFKASEVKQRVEKLFDETKDVEQCREQFLQEIMDWTDYFTENCANDLESEESVQRLEEITNLWINYAHFESSLKQFKNAVDVYEKAMQDPYVNKTRKIYQSSADYSTGRNKPGNAQKTLIRGLCAGLSRKDSDFLWQYLLDLTNRQSKVPSTFQQLYNAVKAQLPEGLTLSPLPENTEITVPSKETAGTFVQDTSESKDNDITTHIKPEASPSIKPVAIIDLPPTTMLSQPAQLHDPAPTTTVASATATSISDDFDNLSGMTPEQVVHLFRNRPFMLFVAPNQEPMASGVSNLNPKEKQILETFLGLPLRALSIFDEKAMSSPERKKAEYYLDIIEELYYLQALKERHFDAWITELRSVHATEEKVLMNKLRATCGSYITAQNPDVQKFRKHCAVQIELLTSIINKIMFSILIEQEQILADLHFPFFTGNFIHQLNDVLHQKKIALQNRQYHEINATKTFFHAVINQDLLYQQKILCSLLSIRFQHLEQLRYQKRRSSGNTPNNKQGNFLKTQQQTVALMQRGGVKNTQTILPQQLPLEPKLDPGNEFIQSNNNITINTEGMELAHISSEDYYESGGGDGRGKRRKRRRRSRNMQHHSLHQYGPQPGENDNYYNHNEDYSNDYEDGSETPNSGVDQIVSEEDFVQSSDYPMLTRQYSNNYSDASISSYTQSVYQNDVMMQDLLQGNGNNVQQEDLNYQSSGVGIVDDQTQGKYNQQLMYGNNVENDNFMMEQQMSGGMNENDEEDPAALFEELRSIIQK